MVWITVGSFGRWYLSDLLHFYFQIYYWLWLILNNYFVFLGFKVTLLFLILTRLVSLAVFCILLLLSHVSDLALWRRQHVLKSFIINFRFILSDGDYFKPRTGCSWEKFWKTFILVLESIGNSESIRRLGYVRSTRVAKLLLLSGICLWLLIFGDKLLE